MTDIHDAVENAFRALDANGAASTGVSKRSQSSELVDLASAGYTFGRATSGEPFAVPIDGPRIAHLLRGGRDSLRASLAHEYASARGRVPSAAALTDALLVLEGRTQQYATTPLGLRVARVGDGRLALDLGRADGRSIVISRDGWHETCDPGVLWRRTELTGELPSPVPGGNVELLRRAARMSDESWPLVLGALLLAFDPEVAHPIVALLGEQGAGKSTAARILAGTLDPSPAPLRSSPRDLTDWSVAASGSYFVPLDNLSYIGAWLSDALCRASTGDGLVRRALYTDSAVSVLTFRRVVLLTSIDVGALRGDLGDRLLTVELDNISDTERETDEALAARWESDHPQALGGLLDLACGVLEALPTVRPARLPRMADFGRWLAALDHVTGADATGAYHRQRDGIAEQVIEGDPVGAAIRVLVAGAPWAGTADELRRVLGEQVDDETRRARSWPRTARAMGGAVRRCAPALRSVGVPVSFGRDAGQRLITLGAPVASRDERSRSSQPSSPGLANDGCDDLNRHSQTTTAGDTRGPGTGRLPSAGACDRCGADSRRRVLDPATGRELCPDCCHAVDAERNGGHPQ